MAIKGDKLLDFITAPWYNAVTQKINVKTGIPRLPFPDQYWYVTVLNHAAIAVPKWTAVSLGGAALNYDTALGHAHNDIIFHTADYDSNDPDNLAILVEPLPGIIGGSARALMCGVSWMRVPEALGSLPPYIHIEDIEPSMIPGLAFANSGRIEILRTFNFTAPYGSPVENVFSLMMFGPSGPMSALILGPTTAPEDPEGESSEDTGYLGLAIIGKKPTRHLYRFVLLEDANNAQPLNAIIKERDGTVKTIGNVLFNTEDIFTLLENGHKGWCYLQDEEYEMLQAKCPEDQ